VYACRLQSPRSDILFFELRGVLSNQIYIIPILYLCINHVQSESSPKICDDPFVPIPRNLRDVRFTGDDAR